MQVGLKKEVYILLNNRKERPRFKSRSRIKTITGAFLAVIAAGTLLLCLPFAANGPGRADFLTALFTATSATCVTGLAVVDTATYWSLGGRMVILCLIQIGGLGVMMIGASVALAARRKITIGERMLLSTSLNIDEISGIVRLAKVILTGTFVLETAGAAVLTAVFMRDFTFWEALERGVFISVSAFCNAGFDNLGVGGEFSSIISYGGNIPLLLTIAALIILGGIGFYVWNDIIQFFRRKKRLSLHSRVALIMTGILLAGGTVGFLITEWNSPLMAGENGVTRIVQCFFQSTTARTAGFDHLGQGTMNSASLALTDILMFIGGSPGSAAGGVKTTTIAVLAMVSFSSLVGKKRVTTFGRTISQDAINQAMSLFFLAGAAAALGAFVISIADGVSFSAAIYESISAIATVGLSTGITPTLGTFSRIFLVLLMFLGRVGIITVGMAAFMKSYPDDSIKLPEGKILIG